MTHILIALVIHDSHGIPHRIRDYRGATVSRLLEIIGLLYKRALQKRTILCKETYNIKEPTNRSHPMVTYMRT